MNQQREFVQIPQQKLTDVTLKFATGVQCKGQFGPYLVYTVLHEGKEKGLKVSDRLEKQFRKLDVKVGETLSLLKETIVPHEGEPFTVINVLERKPATPPTALLIPVAQSRPRETPPPVQPETPSNGTPPPSSPQVDDSTRREGFSGHTLTMYRSLIDAVDITNTIEGVDWRNTDIEKIGVCLFLSRTGHPTEEQVFTNGNGNGNGTEIKGGRKVAVPF